MTVKQQIYFAILSTLIISLFSIALQATLPIDRDVAYYFSIDKFVLLGKINFLDDAPFHLRAIGGFQFLLYIIPAFISTVFPVSDEITIKIFIFIISLISLSLFASFQKIYSETYNRKNYFSIPIYAYLIFLLPTDFFGQREHFFFLLFTPYILNVFCRIKGINWRAGSSFLVIAMAATAILIKPFFVVPWFALELLVLYATRDVRAVLTVANYAIIIANGIYYSLLLIFFMSVGMDQILEGMSIQSHAVGAGLWSIIFRKLSILWILALIAYAIFRWKIRLTNKRESVETPSINLPDILFVAFVSSLAVVLIQHQGNGYHWLPAIVFGCLGLFWGVEEIYYLSSSDGSGRSGFSFYVSVIFFGLFSVLVSYRTIKSVERNWNGRQQIEAYSKALTEAANGQPFVVISRGSFPIYPLAIDAGLFYASRFFSFFVVDVLSQKKGNQTDKKKNLMIEELLKDIGDDFAKWKPQVIVLADTTPAINTFFNNPKIKPIIKKYKYFRTVNSTRFFRLESGIGENSVIR